MYSSAVRELTRARPRYANKQLTLSHTRLAGGVLTIPADGEAAFIRAYSKDLETGSDPHTFCELATPIAPFFIDIDLVCDTLPSGKDIRSWVVTASKAVAEVLRSVPEDDALIKEGYVTKRSQLPSSAVVLLRSTAKKPYANGMRKCGLHLVWPHVLLSTKGNDMIDLKNFVVERMLTAHSDIDWSKVIDSQVYQGKPSLRMTESFKTRVCDCTTRDDRDERKATLERKKTEVAKRLGKDKKSFFDKDIREFTRKVNARVSLVQGGSTEFDGNLVTKDKRLVDAYWAAKSAISCPDCNSSGKVTDPEKGVYKMIGIHDGKTGRQLVSVFKDIKADIAETVWTCSIRRPLAKKTAVIEYPESFARVSKNQRVEKRKTDDVLVPEATKKGRSIRDVATSCSGEVQEYLRTLCPELRGIEVKKVYRLYGSTVPKKKVYTSKTGEAFFTVVSAVDGPGSHYCRAKGGVHGSNKVYFELSPDGICYQKCRSKKESNCSKARVSMGMYPVPILLDLYEELACYNEVTDREEKWFQERGPSDERVKKFVCDRIEEIGKEKKLYYIPPNVPYRQYMNSLRKTLLTTRIARKKQREDELRLVAAGTTIEE